MFEGIFINKLFPVSKKKFNKNDMILCFNKSNQFSYFVKSGSVKIFATNYEGNEKILFIHEAGSLFGFQIFSYNEMKLAKAVALEDTVLYQFETEVFYEFIRNSPDYFAFFLNYIYKLLASQTKEVISLSLFNTDVRLADLLVKLEKKYNRDLNKNVFLPFNNEDLASILGVSRNTISNAITKLYEEKIIEKKRNGLIIKDFERLQKYGGLK